MVLATAATALLVAAGASPLDPSASYPEGPLVWSGAVYVAEMGADRVSVIADGEKRAFWTDPGCGPTALAPFGDGLLVACHRAGDLVVIDRAGATLRRLGSGAPDAAGWQARARLIGQPNDLSADDRGGVYASSPGPFSKRIPSNGRVIRVGPDGGVTAVAEGLWYPNGVYFDAARRALFVSEHLARRVWRYPIEPNGALGPASLFADIDALGLPAPSTPPYAEAGPDGLERAPNGDLVVALYGEGRLVRLGPDGRLKGVVETPFAFVTNLAFLADGSAVVVGAYDNAGPGLPGAAVRLEAQRFVD